MPDNEQQAWQTQSDQRQDRQDVRQREDRVTLRDVLEISRDVQFAVISMNGRIDKLVETTNHRLEAFEGVLDTLGETHSGLMTKADLPESLFAMIMHSRWFWLGTATYVSILMPVVIDHWRMLFAHFGI